MEETKYVIVNIMPKYVRRILAGTKKMEVFKYSFSQPVYGALIYECYPTKKITATFIFGNIISGSPKYIWEKYNKEIDMDAYDYYNRFRKWEYAHAVEIVKPRKLSKSMELSYVQQYVIYRDRHWLYIGGDIYAG